MRGPLKKTVLLTYYEPGASSEGGIMVKENWGGEDNAIQRNHYLAWRPTSRFQREREAGGDRNSKKRDIKREISAR